MIFLFRNFRASSLSNIIGPREVVSRQFMKTDPVLAAILNAKIVKATKAVNAHAQIAEEIFDAAVKGLYDAST